MPEEEKELNVRDLTRIIRSTEENYKKFRDFLHTICYEGSHQYHFSIEIDTTASTTLGLNETGGGYGVIKLKDSYKDKVFDDFSRKTYPIESDKGMSIEEIFYAKFRILECIPEILTFVYRMMEEYKEKTTASYKKEMEEVNSKQERIIKDYRIETIVGELKSEKKPK